MSFSKNRMLLLCALLPAHTTFSAGAIERETREVRGWTLHINRALLADDSKAATDHAIELLEKQLDEIIRVVPSNAVAELRKVPLYFSPPYSNATQRAEFHSDAGWLRGQGRDPAMAKAVEFTNIRGFERATDRMPNFTLHELAHAYHSRVVPDGFGNKEIKQAYEHAKESGKYDKVERYIGGGRKVKDSRAYAMTNPMEYFAENTEAYFSRNDFFPYTREELQQHDPECFFLLEKLWGVRPAK
jgi:hypothetical protein